MEENFEGNKGLIIDYYYSYVLRFSKTQNTLTDFSVSYEVAEIYIKLL